MIFQLHVRTRHQLSGGRFGYSILDGDTKLLAKMLKIFKNNKYESL